jgi:GTPase SAR1 family protein
MDSQQPRHQIPKIRFRVLIIGRANAGKTSILQRVCDTTESPAVYRMFRGPEGPDSEEVRRPTFLSASRISPPTR